MPLLRLSLFAPCALLAGLLTITPPAQAVIVLGGRDASGTLNGSGTNANPAPFDLGSYEGRFGGFLGTPIASNYFVTAAHIGDQGAFVFDNGTSTPTTYKGATLVGTDNDLAIWKIPDSGPAFSYWAPLYTGAISTGQDLVVLGRGTLRGSEISGAGWELGGTNPAAYSWGSSTVSGSTGFDTLGHVISFDFVKKVDASGNLLNPDQAIASTGDSGGGSFILDPTDGRYKLLGVIYGVDAPRLTPTSPNLSEVLYDARGYSINGGRVLGLDRADPVPLSSWVTDISSRVDYLDQVTGLKFSVSPVPEPSALALGCLGGFGWTGAWCLRRARVRRRSQSA